MITHRSAARRTAGRRRGCATIRSIGFAYERFSEIKTELSPGSIPVCRSRMARR